MPRGIGYASTNPYAMDASEGNFRRRLARELLGGVDTDRMGRGEFGYDKVLDPNFVRKMFADNQIVGTPGQGNAQLAILPSKKREPNEAAEIIGALNAGFQNVSGNMRDRAMNAALQRMLGQRGGGNFFGQMYPELGIGQGAAPAAAPSISSTMGLTPAGVAAASGAIADLTAAGVATAAAPAVTGAMAAPLGLSGVGGAASSGAAAAGAAQATGGAGAAAGGVGAMGPLAIIGAALLLASNTRQKKAAAQQEQLGRPLTEGERKRMGVYGGLFGRGIG